MQKITYVGPFDAVEFEQGSVWRSCAKGQSIDVPDAVAASLLEQSDNWQPTKKTAAKSAAVASESEED